MNLSDRVKNIKPSVTLEITAKTKELIAEGQDISAFLAGEPDFDTPEYIKKGAIQAINDGATKYTPASGTVELKKAIVEKFRRDNGLNYTPEQIVVSNGGKHSLTNIFLSILNDGDEVIVITPFWLSYKNMIEISGGVPVFVETKIENDFLFTKEDIQKAITSKTKAIIVNSPNNPTGVVYDLEHLKIIADIAKENDLYIISDEIYEKLIYDNKKHTSIATLSEDAYARTIVVNGLSKGYSMTGWRVGYIACDKRLAKAIGSLQSHMTSNPCSISQKAAVVALNEEQNNDLSHYFEMFETRRDLICSLLDGILNLTYFKPKGAFYVVIDFTSLQDKVIKGTKLTSATDVAKVLLNDYKVAVIPLEDFGLNMGIRLSYACSEETIKTGISRIKKFMDENVK